MFKKILIQLNKYKLFIFLLLIIVFFILVKINTKQEVNKVVTDQIKSRIVVENNKEVAISLTPTNKIEEEKDEANGYISINDLFPYEDNTFLAEKYENNKVYAKSKIDNKEKAERNLKYWYYLEIGGTLPSEKIIWE